MKLFTLYHPDLFKRCICGAFIFNPACAKVPVRTHTHTHTHRPPTSTTPLAPTNTPPPPHPPTTTHTDHTTPRHATHTHTRTHTQKRRQIKGNEDGKDDGRDEKGPLEFPKQQVCKTCSPTPHRDETKGPLGSPKPQVHLPTAGRKGTTGMPDPILTRIHTGADQRATVI